MLLYEVPENGGVPAKNRGGKKTAFIFMYIACACVGFMYIACGCVGFFIVNEKFNFQILKFV